MFFEEGFGNRRRHASYQGVIEKLRALHRKAVPVKFEMIDIEILRKDQFADETRETTVLAVIEKRLLNMSAIDSKIRYKTI